MNKASVVLLQAAAEIMGGNRALAEHLGIGETLLAKFMSGSIRLPDPLVLRTADIILDDRQSRPSGAVREP